MTRGFDAAMVVRGTVVTDDAMTFGGRGGGMTFRSPDPARHAPRLPLADARALGDLHTLRFDEILDYCDALGERLRLDTNPHLQEAYEASCLASSQTPPLLRGAYAALPGLFARAAAREMAESTIGIDHLEGWVPRRMEDGRTVAIRAFGARTVHVIAGNSPLIAAFTILRNALTRGDAIVKSPSNDPFTALAIARTMIDLDPVHPLTKHLSVAYWKGGDEAVETRLYQPRHIEKIVAWGGFASVKHVTRYIQPGLELISLDPKRSASIVGPQAFADERTESEVAMRLATDIGAMNQEGCVSARVIYVLSGTDDNGLARVNRLGRRTYAALQALPTAISTPAKDVDGTLRSMVEAARLNEEWYRVTGGEDGEGAIIVSQLPEPVDFAPMLGGRVANLVPVDDIADVLDMIDSATQTIGIYPEALKERLADPLALAGAQRLTSLGYAASASGATPQDGVETMRRMCKWIVREDCEPDEVAPLWRGSRTAELEISA